MICARYSAPPAGHRTALHRDPAMLEGMCVLWGEGGGWDRRVTETVPGYPPL